MLQVVSEQAPNTDIVMFSELSLTGYPPEDLIFRADFEDRCLVQLDRLQKASQETAIIVGHPWYEGDDIYNALSFSIKANCMHVILNKNYQITACLMSLVILPQMKNLCC